MRLKISGWLAVGCIGLLVACGDDTGTGGAGGTGASSADGGSSSGGAPTGGSPSTGGGGSSQGGAGGAGGAASNGGGGSTGDGGAGGAGGAGGTASNGGGGAGGGPPALVNGCDISTAEDHTTEDVIDLTWTFPHQECIRVHANATVRWSGSFGFHPLVGGVTPTTDATSPITASDQSGAIASVTFGTAGEYPYFCTAHLSAMQGVVYVE